MFTSRAFFRRFCAFEDVTAINAMPLYYNLLLENLTVGNIGG
jgi:hypothetical protein